MADKQYGLLGRPVFGYLANRSASSSVRIAIGGRTISKVQELANEYSNVGSIHADVTDEQSVVDAVAKTRVVINIAGPYWTRGSVVVKACANHGAHYLDLTSEAPFVERIIQDYDYLAHKNHTVIIPCSGYDSIPFDLAAYLASKPSRSEFQPWAWTVTVHITSTAAHIFKGGLSGGTAATLIDAFEEVPEDKRGSGQGWALSPVSGQTEYSPVLSILYKLPRIQPIIYGGCFPMVSINEPIVRRSWGLRERFRRETKSGTFRSLFSYSEFHQTRSPFSGVALNTLTKEREGPAPEKLDKGRFEVINVSEGAGVAVKSAIKGDGDPGYRLTSIMIVESVLLLDPSNLTPLGQQGGILTPSAAFGARLVQALEWTGRFKASVEVLESKKTR